MALRKQKLISGWDEANAQIAAMREQIAHMKKYFNEVDINKQPIIVQAIVAEVTERTDCLVRRGAFIHMQPRSPVIHISLIKHGLKGGRYAGIGDSAVLLNDRPDIKGGTWVEFGHPSMIDKVAKYLGERWSVVMGRYSQKMVGMARGIIEGTLSNPEK